MKRIIKGTLLAFILLSSALIFSQSASAYSGCPGVCWKSYSCHYDCCTGCTTRTVTYWQSYYNKYKGCTCDCGCPKYYCYYKHYNVPVKSVKYYYPSSCCNSCSNDSCNYSCNNSCCNNDCNNSSNSCCN